MLLPVLLGAGTLATVMTLVWLLRERRTPVAGFVSMAAWGTVAIGAGDPVAITDSGDQVAVAPQPSIQFIAAALALLSFGAVLAYLFGLYPPDDSVGPTDAQDNIMPGGARRGDR